MKFTQVCDDKIIRCLALARWQVSQNDLVPGHGLSHMMQPSCQSKTGLGPASASVGNPMHAALSPGRKEIVVEI